MAFQSYGMPPLVRAEIKKEARSSTPNVLEAGIAAFIEYNLELVEKVASLNAANAQVINHLCHVNISCQLPDTMHQAPS